mmetsp:Transcript_23416/g.57863  ORF Transcript_23416/g.57863 Transcript_23416/m.57863 type:complete len:80 (+) Transcript_23416:179-418(+)
MRKGTTNVCYSLMEWSPMSLNRLCNSMVMMIYCIYIPMVVSVTCIFQCFRYPNGRFSLIHMPYTLCYDAKWWSSLFRLA